MTTEEQELADLLRSDELEKIEKRTSKFNVFRALSLERMEIRHSQFLAWLLNPKETHGLGDFALREFLKIVSQTGESGFTIFDLDGWDLDGTDVLTEWEHIDILLRNDKYKFVCVIENKIDTQDHSQQLDRYKKLVFKKIGSAEKGWKNSFLYLTPDGTDPLEDEDASYTSISYAFHIHKLMEKICLRFEGKLDSGVMTFIKNYKNLLEENIMENDEIVTLCRNIYKNHKAAFDLILKHRPDLRSRIADILTELIKKDSGLQIESSNPTHVIFFPKVFNKYPFLKDGDAKGSLLLVFDFALAPEWFYGFLRLSPGEQKIREIVFETALKNREILKPRGQLSPNARYLAYEPIYKDYDGIDDWSEEQLRQDLTRKFEEFKIKINKILEILLPEFDKFKE